MRKELWGGAWDGRVIELPDHLPNEVLMPWIDTGVSIISYQYDQEKGFYKVKEGK